MIVKGKIHQIAEGSRLEIKIYPGPYTLLFFLGLYALTAFMLFQAVVYGFADNIIPGIIWFLIFPVSGTLFLNYNVKKVENKVKELFVASEMQEETY